MDWDTEAVEVSVNNSPAALFNNLSSDGERLVYCSKAHVCVIPDQFESGTARDDVQVVAYKDTLPIFDATALRLDNGMPTIAVMSRSGAYFYSSPSSLFAHVPTSACGSSGRAVFLRGAAVVPGAHTVAVGASNGAVVLCDSNDPAFAPKGRLEGGAAPITSIAASARFILAGDDAGAVRVWSATPLRLHQHIRGSDGFPCTGVAIRGDSVVAAFADGHVRVYAVGDGALVSEASAHGRCITALTLHPTENMFATVGEDTLVNVWTLPDPEEKGPALELVASRRRPDMQLSGVAFSRMGSNLVASAYDWPALHVWKRS